MKHLIIIISLIASVGLQAQQKGIINNSESPYVKLKSINIGDCKWTSGFWADKFKNAEDVMVPHMEGVLTGDTGHAFE